MRRRAFIMTFGLAAVWPLAARTQKAIPVVGMLNSGPSEPRRDQLEGFHRGLKEAGFVVGQNVSILHLGADDRYDRLPALAAELVRRRVAVIAAVGGPVSALAAKAATSTIPIVFAAVSDPVRSGLVASFNRPGGNVTGNAGLSIELDAKRFEILGELAPTAKVVGALINPNRPGVEIQEQELRVAAKAGDRDLVVLRAGDSHALEAAFATLTERKITVLLVGADAFFNNNRPQIVALAARHAVMAIYPWREFTSEGGLVSYGTNLPVAYREAGDMLVAFSKGKRPPTCRSPSLRSSNWW